MYQLLLIMALLLSIGGAAVISISRGSAAKAYTSLSSPSSLEAFEMEGENAFEKSITLAEKETIGDPFMVVVFKTLIGVETEVKASPLLTRTISGTYACQATSSLNSPCSNEYIFVFKPNSAAVLKIEDTETEGIKTTQVGTWAVDDEGHIVVSLFADRDGRFEEERRFTLLRGRKAQLIAIDYPREVYPDIVTGIFKFIKK